ncbi:alkylation response protein AidB-like acyl-CoA dehydrogenase [Melghirimyces profundicolus]|uniref:Alkylation response protein AidB-like acyl-CoA dehydrogenase n=1 Tax=Melghirimyces profundicolus TaxID=1242148 RepID=A0A2T6C9H0_9BACL|nr:acyl-CoA dehydrogenase family protein [Melghirimyces profundicolus]PTX64967.1 alkylation response protein AidB-like acyl-CoA dehydrogenase [Melghirimyces profundicolus]
MIDYSRYEDGTGLNWYESDYTMQYYARRYLSPAILEWGEEKLVRMGAYTAGPMDARARHTDREGAPRLIRYNRKGEEINEIRYNEGYLQTVGDAFESGVVGWRYRDDVPEKVPFFFTQLLHMLMSGAETGFTCPVTLTMSVAFVLEKFGTEEQKETYLPLLASMDRETLEQGATFLTEIAGGSDVGATETRAVPEGDHYLLTGEKWFASNCDAGVAITLARVSDQPGTKGLGLFLLPRRLPDGTRNRITIRRLKDKLGVRAVASGELELKGAVGYLIGEPEEGFKYMAEALNISRMCTATGALAISRRAFLEAAIYTARRSAFGQVLHEYPMVRETLLNMMTDIEAGWALTARMIELMDRCHTYGEASEDRLTLLRLLLAMAKYRLSEKGVEHAKSALELHGGNGYIEEYVTPRLLRDAQVNTVWEGPSNIMALEILKTLGREAKRTGGRHSAILEEMKETLNRVTLPELSDAAQCVRERIPELYKDARYLLSADPVVQNAHARRFADRLTDVYSAVRLLEEARHARVTDGSSRLMKVAEYFVDRTFRPRVHDIRSGSIPSVELFDEVVCFKEETGVRPS